MSDEPKNGGDAKKIIGTIVAVASLLIALQVFIFTRQDRLEDKYMTKELANVQYGAIQTQLLDMKTQMADMRRAVETLTAEVRAKK